MKIFVTGCVALLFSTLLLNEGFAQAQGSQTSQGYYKGGDLEKLTLKPERVVVMKTRQGVIKLQLFEKIAPRNVENFLRLVDSGFYDGTTFHRGESGFVIQGGDPNSKDDDLSNDGEGQPGQTTVRLERSKLKHDRGILSMARKFDENSATSQFFIMLGPAPQLDYQFSVFGQVVEGIEVADRIAALPKESGENPGKAGEIISVTVEEDESQSFRSVSKKR